MIKVNYLDALKAIKQQDFPCYVVTGKEPYQKNKLIEAINQKYKAQNFEILRDQIIAQQYDFLQSNFNSFSLFSKERLLQLHISKAPDKDAQKLLVDCLSNISANDRFLLIFDDLTSAQHKAKWFQSIIQNALYVQVWPVNVSEAIRLIKLELSSLAKPVSLTPEALMLLAQKTEGNLFAANQILTLLQHQSQSHFDEVKLAEYLTNAMNYDVFDLGQSLIEHNLKRSLAILQHLFKEQVDAVLVLWAILKEIRICLTLATQDPAAQQQTYIRNNIWQSKQSAYQRLMKKFTKQHYAQFFNQCFAIDLIIKGIEPGNVEQSLTELVVQFHQ
ncbi:DNA polymerase III subunit delta [Caedibacter taeniospiralis]|uniref:DNA polymerase III subunit delta n=1 Tax=Caedibacter taeniospiralis TaxID=28907 RepID=UPI000C27F69F|nr:DNA polymerase III subunit delta [Caedibacter taeniospiralis]